MEKFKSVDTSVNLEAEQALSEAGFSIRYSTLTEAKLISDRDINEDYSILSAIEYNRNKSIKVMVVDYQGIPCGFTAYGVDTTTGEAIGKVEMIHISQAVRGRGVYNLLGTLSRLDIVRNNPQVQKLQTGVADKSGVVAKLIKSLGFKDTGRRTKDAGSYPEWEYDFSDMNKEEYAQFLQEKVGLQSERIAELMQNRDPINIDHLDRDNPRRESTNVVEKARKNYLEKGVNDNSLNHYFGYFTGDMCIRRTPAYPENRTPSAFILSVNSQLVDINYIQDLLAEEEFRGIMRTNNYSTSNKKDMLQFRLNESYMRRDPANLDLIARLGQLVADHMKTQSGVIR